MVIAEKSCVCTRVWCLLELKHETREMTETTGSSLFECTILCVYPLYLLDVERGESTYLVRRFFSFERSLQDLCVCGAEHGCRLQYWESTLGESFAFAYGKTGQGLGTQGSAASCLQGFCVRFHNAQPVAEARC